MKRLVFTTVALLSLVLTLALASLWVRSHFVLDEISGVDAKHVTQAVVSFAGSAHLIETNIGGSPRRATWDAYPYDGAATLGDMYDPLLADFAIAGFMRLRRPGTESFLSGSVPITPWLTGGMYAAWVVPYWAPTLLVSIPALFAARRLIRRYVRRRRGRCRECGYDLRASGERCPECGAIVPAAQRARTADAVAA